MTLDTPLNIDGKEWPYLTTNMAITSRYSPEGNMDASIALRFIPTRMENGEVITNDQQAMTMYRGSLLELKDANETAAMVAIKNALETLIANKIV
jgi:hypothetical protein